MNTNDDTAGFLHSRWHVIHSIVRLGVRAGFTAHQDGIQALKKARKLRRKPLGVTFESVPIRPHRGNTGDVRTLTAILVNPFTARKATYNVPNLKPLRLLGPLCASTWKEFYQNTQFWKHICDRTIKYTAWRRVSEHLSARKFYRLGQWRG